MITKCPHCNTKFRVSDDYKGRKTKCPKCKQLFTISEFIAKPASSAGETESAQKKLDVCASCGRTIGRLEKPYRFKGEIVCTECDRKLRSRSVDALVGSMPMGNCKRSVIKFNCDRCGASLQASEEMVGYPEVCTQCKNATLVTNESLKTELSRRRKNYLLIMGLRGSSQLFGFLGIVFCSGSKFLGPVFGLVAGLITCIFWILFFILSRMAVHLRNKWVLKLSPKEEKWRQEVCKTILERRAKGQPANLCYECAGTGRSSFWGCRECRGTGYVEY